MAKKLSSKTAAYFVSIMFETSFLAPAGVEIGYMEVS